MNKWSAIWRMIRPINLFIIAFTMIGIWAALSSLLGMYSNASNLIVQTIALCLIAAGGYVINDIQDDVSDKNNDKTRNPIGKQISPSQGQSIYWILTLSGLLLSMVNTEIGLDLHVFIIFIFVAASLWIYSTKMQQQVLMGNVIVSIMCAVPVFLGGQVIFGNQTGLIDVFNWSNDSPQIPMRLSLIQPVWSFYLGFAFGLTLVRELIKDIEDTPGDAAAGYHTLAIVYGFSIAKGIALGLSALISLAEIWISYHCYLIRAELPHAWWISIILIAFPLLFVISGIARLKTVQDAGLIAAQLKLVMALGLLTFLYFVFL